MNVLPSGNEALDRVQAEVKRDLDDLFARPLAQGLLHLAPVRLTDTAEIQPGQAMVVYTGAGGHTLTLPKTTDADARSQMLVVCHSGVATGGLLRLRARSGETLGRERYRWMGPGDALALVSDAGGKWFVLESGQAAQGKTRLFEEFVEATTGLTGLVGATNGAAGTLATTVGTAERPGVGAPSTGTTAGGIAGFVSAFSAIETLNGAWMVAMEVFPSALSNGTDRYLIRCGLQDVLGGDATNGVYFRYSDNINAGRWQAVCRNGGAETAVDTGFAAIANYQKLEIEIATQAQLARFYVDGVLRATVTTNIPVNGATSGWAPVIIEKTLGTAARNGWIDWAELTCWLDRVR